MRNANARHKMKRNRRGLTLTRSNRFRTYSQQCLQLRCWRVESLRRAPSWVQCLRCAKVCHEQQLTDSEERGRVCEVEHSTSASVAHLLKYWIRLFGVLKCLRAFFPESTSMRLIRATKENQERERVGQMKPSVRMRQLRMKNGRGQRVAEMSWYRTDSIKEGLVNFSNCYFPFPLRDSARKQQ